MVRAKRSVTPVSALRRLSFAVPMIGSISAACAGVPSLWLNPVDGTWTDATKWSTNPVFPGPGYDAIIDAAGAPYTVTAHAFSVDYVHLNSSSATLLLTPGGGPTQFVVAEELTVQSGTVVLNNGTLINTLVRSTGGTFRVGTGGGTLRAVTLDADLDLDTSLGVQQGLTIAAGRTLRSATSISLDQPQAISGNGQIILDGAGGGRIVMHGNSTTASFSIGSGITIRSGDNGGWIYPQDTAGWTTAGRISAQTPGKTLYLGGKWSSTGTLLLSGGTLMLGGAFSSSDLNNFSRTGGTLAFAGTMTNAGTFELNENTGYLHLVRDDRTSMAGQIVGGTLSTAGTAHLISRLGAVRDLWLDCDVIVPSFGSFSTIGSVHIDHRTVRLQGASIALAEQLSGTAEIIFDAGESSSNGARVGGPSGPSVVGEDITLRTGTGSVTISGQNFGFVNNGRILASPDTSITMVNIGTFANHGLMRADDASLTIAGNWQNHGTIVASNSNLGLGGTFSASSLGNIHLTGASTVNMVGRFENVGSTFTLDAVTGTWNIRGGIINGGTIQTAAGAQLRVGSSTLDSRFYDVKINTDLYIDPGATLHLEGAWENNGVAHIDGGVVYFRGPLTHERFGNLQSNDATLIIAGPLDNVGRVVDLDVASDRWMIMNPGRIDGGTITSSSGAALYLAGGTLSGVVLAADMEVSGFARIKDGLTLQDSQVRIISSTGVTNPSFEGTQTIDGTGEFVIDGNAWCHIRQTGGTLTLGPGITLRSGTGGGGTFGTETSVYRVLNHGTISAEREQRWIAVQGINNYGTIRAVNHGTLLIQTFFGYANTGTIHAGADSVVRFRGSFSNSGTFDVGGTVIIDYSSTSPLPLVLDQLIAGYDGGSWTGGPAAINSSRAAANPGYTVGYAEASAIFPSFPVIFAGQEISVPSTLLLHYTRAGDANLDDVVNLLDFNALAANFGRTDAYWWQGDFNHDRIVNLQDFNRLAANFGLSAGPDGVVDPEDWAALANAIPEPALASLFAVAACLIRRRRR